MGSFKEKINKAYFDYIYDVKLLPDEKVKVIVEVPGKDLKSFEQIEIEFNCPVKAEVKFYGLVVEKVLIEILFPPYLIGKSFILPIVNVSTKSYKSWAGNIGLVWEGLVKGSKIGFYPYENKLQMMSDLKKYSKENIVDPICDFINNYNVDASVRLKKSIAKFIADKKNLAWRYKSGYDSTIENVLQVPINMEFEESENSSYINFKFYAVGDEWVPLSKIVLDFLAPLSEITAYFNDEGELMSEEEIAEVYKALMEAKTKREAEEKLKAKGKAVKSSADIESDKWDPFKQEKNLKRDEFGFLIDKRKAEFGTKDVDVARKRILEEGHKQYREILIKENSKKPPEPQDTSRWPNAAVWYNEMQGKRFTITGGVQNLSFTEKGELNILKACNPPFVLRFARDQIRLNNGMITSEIQKLMFKFYKLGFLRRV
ncbi:MAG: hypothetical protein ACTSU2_03400 [Promethearchaeota archaeon]